MRIEITGKDNLAEVLKQSGHAPNLLCGGRGICRRCGVHLLSGCWKVNGQTVHAPADALACQTSLLSASGEIEFVPASENGTVSAGWRTFPLPVRAETVIGVDIGTTTIAAAKIRNGNVLARAGCFNAQSKYGDNVVSRIGAAKRDLWGLKQSVRDSISGLLAELGTKDVSRIAVAGNTVMTCLFHGIDPASIGVLPFTPPKRLFEPSDWNGIPLLTVPCIAGFVGGDLTAGLYEIKLKPGEMLVDIGTNCEIIFSTPRGVVCTAAAAGPAFEGAGLHFGCRAVSGAIDHYQGEKQFTVLDHAAPIGFCGSAFIDFLAVERKTGHLNEFGRFEPKSDRSYVTDRIFISESDIEQLLKAKAAVAAGIRTLEMHCGMTAEKIYLAGGFAQYIDLENAMAIGMLPERKYQIVGNTSLAGASRLAAAPEIMPELVKLIDLPREIELNTIPGFEDNFIDGLLLP